MVHVLPENLRYVGVDDVDLDLFESQFALPQGISYNSYLLFDRQIVLFDTVDLRCCETWLSRVESALEARAPDYLVLHHLEPDHSGSLERIMARYPHLEIVATTMAVRMLPQLFPTLGFAGRIHAVSDGDTLSVGRSTLHFMTAPMVHWPEVMVTCLDSEQVLFSADAFGTFGARRHPQPWRDEARRYYFNICGKYGVQVQQLLQKIAPLSLAMICPLHGPELHAPLDSYLALYDTWSRYAPESNGVLIAHASIYGTTAAAAEVLAERLREGTRQPIVVVDLCRQPISFAVGEAFRMRTIVLAAATYDGGLFPPMTDFLHRLKIKGFRNRRVALIESGSWAPAANRLMRETVATMEGVEVFPHAITLRGRIGDEDRASIERLAQVILQ